MKRTRDIGVAVVGLGRMGRVHAEALAHRVPGACLVGVCDSRRGVGQAVGAALGVAAWSRAAEMFDRPDVDAVVVATPVATHCTLIEAAAAARRHIMCEKPFARDEVEARRAIAAVERAGVKLQVGFHRRYDADFDEAARRIHDGELGHVYQYHASMRDMQPPADDVVRAERVIVDAMCHDFDAARWIVGEIEEVTTFGTTLSADVFREIGDPDNTIVVVRFANGAIGVLENSRVAGYAFDCRTEVVGAAGTVRVAAPRRTHTSWLTPEHETRDLHADFLDRFRAAYPLELEDFVAAIREDRPVRVSGWDGLAAVRLCEAAMRSWSEGRTVRVEPLER